jgi:hypothetical protein
MNFLITTAGPSLLPSFSSAGAMSAAANNSKSKNNIPKVNCLLGQDLLGISVDFGQMVWERRKRWKKWTIS